MSAGDAGSERPVGFADAETYDRVSDPQVAWATEVLERLPLRGDERVLDAGCGTGRVTRLLLERLPLGSVVAVDASPEMVEKASAALDGRAETLCADLSDLALDEPVDAVFSSAVFHWIPNHDRLFRRLHDALRPGGRMVAQCGGSGNVAAFHERVREIAQEPPYAKHLAEWEGPWNFATPEDTRESLQRAGFPEADCWLEPRAVRPEDPRAFLRTVCLGPHLERLPADVREAFVGDIVDDLGRGLELDYVRLNIAARRPE